MQSEHLRILKTPVSRWQIKLLLSLFAIVLITAVLLYTKVIVDELIANERRTVELYVNLIKKFQQQANDEELLFYMEVTYQSIHFPLIITDKDERPLFPFQQFMLNVPLDSTTTLEEQRQYLEEVIRDMKSEYRPYEVATPEGQVVQKIFFSNSAVISRLRYMPYVELVAVTAFVIIGYVAFSSLRSRQEANIWVGMAKEAAHQLGTPLSSLLAWLELLRLNKDSPEQVERTAAEMARDLERLNVIANRFGKIGSRPNLEVVDISAMVENVALYFEARLPNLGRRIKLVRKLDSGLLANVNVDLFAWVLENLVRNAVDSIERRGGTVELNATRKNPRWITLCVRDDGKGMTAAIRSRVFQPGFTTKKRGWGLGLSLSRRIVEDYHRGKIFVKETSPGEGTTFAIELPAAESAT